jgi:ribosome-binding protein aMBF1 (putative translation factor)
MKKCDICRKKGNWKSIWRPTYLVKTDGSDIIVCNTCLNHIGNGEWDKLSDRAVGSFNPEKMHKEGTNNDS